MMFIAYDDEGVIFRGTKRECLDSIALLAEDLDNVYSENEIIEISNYFSRKHLHSNSIHFSGFSVTTPNECWCAKE